MRAPTSLSSLRSLCFAVASALGGCALLGACSGELSSRGSPTSPSQEQGRMTLAFDNTTGLVVPSFDWTLFAADRSVLGAGTVGTDPTTQEASLDLSVPVSSGDVLHLAGTSTGGVRCVGESAPFNVTAGRITAVNLVIVCGTGSGGPSLGEVRVASTLVEGDHCPTLQAWSFVSAPPSADPDAVSGDGDTRVQLDVVATDLDEGEHLTYSWASEDGLFLNPASPHTVYVCGRNDPATLTVAISDDHAPNRCTVAVTFPPVACP